MAFSKIIVHDIPEAPVYLNDKVSPWVSLYHNYYSDKINQAIIYITDPTGYKRSWVPSDPIEVDSNNFKTKKSSAEFTVDKLGTWKVSFKFYFEEVYDGFRTYNTDTYSFDVIERKLEPELIIFAPGQTIKPQETVTYVANITGVEAPFSASYKWFRNGELIGTESSTKLSFLRLGQDKIRCEVTVSKDGYPDATVSRDTVLNQVKGELPATVMITGIDPSYEIGNQISVMVEVQGIDNIENHIVTYDWTVDDISQNVNDRNFKFTPSSVGSHTVGVVVTITAENFDGATVSAKFPIEVTKIKDWDYTYTVKYDNNQESLWWGDTGKETIYLSLEYPDGSTIDFENEQGFIDDVLQQDSINKTLGFAIDWKYRKTTEIGPHKAKFVFDTKPHPKYETRTGIVIEEDFVCRKSEAVNAFWYINDVMCTEDFTPQIKGAPLDTITFDITCQVFNPFNEMVWGDPTYADDQKSVMTSGTTYIIYDNENKEVLRSNDGKFTYTLPNEIKPLKGKVELIIDRPELFEGPISVFRDITIDIVSNPLVPTPTLKIVQEPEQAILGSTAKFKRSFTDRPENATDIYSNWKVNDIAVEGDNDEITYSAQLGTVVTNDSYIDAQGYDPVALHATKPMNVVLKPWPTISLSLTPNKTSVPWGELLTAVHNITGLDLIENSNELTIHKPTWYLDNNIVESIKENELAIPAIHPGKHTIKGVIKLSHPDYVNQELTLEKSFTMTTEPRIMATTVKITPVDASIATGKSQLFTATVSGIEEIPDAITTYAWTVDDAAQDSTVSTMTYKPAKAGTYSVKVVATTKAQDAEDSIAEDTVTLTVEDNVMDLTVLLTTDKQLVTIGDQYTLTCEVIGAPEGATIDYNWGGASPDNTNSITLTAVKENQVAFSCKVTVNAPNYQEAKAESNAVYISVTGKVMNPSVVIATETPTIKLGESYTVTSTVTEIPEGATVAYKWSDGSTGDTLTKTPTEAGSETVKLTIDVSATDYDPANATSNELTITVKTADVPEECPLVYVHPLPHRNTAYIWTGWWVMDAIEKLTKEGKDWKSATKEDSPYYCHLAVLAKMLDDFPEVDVQESRNGRIIHRSAFEVGIIY